MSNLAPRDNPDPEFGADCSTMNDASSDGIRAFQRNPARTSIEVDGVANANGGVFGTRIMENIIAGQLKGKVRFDWRDQGLACEIVLPLA